MAGANISSLFTAAGAGAAGGTAGLVSLGDVLVTKLPDKLAGLPQALTLAGKVVEQQEGTATLRTPAGDVQLKTTAPLPTDRPVTLQVPPQAPGVGTKAAALAPLARPAAAETQAPAPASQTQAPTPSPAQQPVMQPGAVVSAVLVAAPPKQPQPRDPAAGRPPAGGEGTQAPSASGSSPAPAPAVGLGLFRPTGGSTGGGGNPEAPQGSAPASGPSQAAPSQVSTPSGSTGPVKPQPGAATSFLASLANLPPVPDAGTAPQGQGQPQQPLGHPATGQVPPGGDGPETFLPGNNTLPGALAAYGRALARTGPDPSAILGQGATTTAASGAAPTVPGTGLAQVPPGAGLPVSGQPLPPGTAGGAQVPVPVGASLPATPPGSTPPPAAPAFPGQGPAAPAQAGPLPQGAGPAATAPAPTLPSLGTPAQVPPDAPPSSSPMPGATGLPNSIGSGAPAPVGTAAPGGPATHGAQTTAPAPPALPQTTAAPPQGTPTPPAPPAATPLPVMPAPATGEVRSPAATPLPAAQGGTPAAPLPAGANPTVQPGTTAPAPTAPTIPSPGTGASPAMPLAGTTPSTPPGPGTTLPPQPAVPGGTAAASVPGATPPLPAVSQSPAPPPVAWGRAASPAPPTPIVQGPTSGPPAPTPPEGSATPPTMPATRPTAGAAEPAAPRLTAGQPVQVRILSLGSPGEASPLPTTPVPQEEPILPGTYVGTSLAGQPLVSTAQGTLVLQARIPQGLPSGTALALAVLAPELAAPTPPAIDPLHGRDWPALREAMAVLAATDPSLAKALAAAILPQPNKRLAANIAFFLAALRGGEAADWLGSQGEGALSKAGRQDLLSRLSEDFRAIQARAQEPLPEGWRCYALPFEHQGQVTRLQLHVRAAGEDEPGAEREKRGMAKRFLLDLDFNRLGPMQLDGLVRPGQMDLVVRTRDLLPTGLTRELGGIYRASLDVAGYAGTLSFQTGAHRWVRPQTGGRGASA